MEQLSAALYADGLPPARAALVLKPESPPGQALVGFFLLPGGWDELRPGVRCSLRTDDGRVARFVFRRVGRRGPGAPVVAAEFAAPPAAPAGRAEALSARASFEEWLAG